MTHTTHIAEALAAPPRRDGVPAGFGQRRHPSSAELRREFAADRIAADDIAAAMAMRSVLVAARTLIASLQFNTGFPVTGWDAPSTLAMLDDITPDCGPEFQRQVHETAFENLGGVIL